MASPERVVIIGGGIGGLTAALALAAARPRHRSLRAVGRAQGGGRRNPDQLERHPRSLRARARRRPASCPGSVPSGREIRHWSTGETWSWFELGAAAANRYGTPHLMLHRGDLHGLLADAVRGVKPDAIRLGKRCVGVSQSDKQVEVRFDTGEAAHRRLRDRCRRHPLEDPRIFVRARSPRVHRLRGMARPGADGTSTPISRGCSAPTGSGPADMCCTIRCAAAS